MTKFYFSLLLPTVILSTNLNAQNTVLFQQTKDSQGSMVSTTSTTSVKMYSADDFIVSSNSKINKITLEGAQLQGNLSTILGSVDVVILEAAELTGTPFNGNIVYQSMASLTGVTVTSTGGISKNFEIDLSNNNVQVESGKKYWLIFTANSNLSTSNTFTDWYWYPAPHNASTSISKKYYNGIWSANSAGLTFKIEGSNTLGTTEFMSNSELLLKNTLVEKELTIMMSDFAEAEIYDLSGKKILHSKQTTIAVNHLSSGNYLIVLQSKNGIRKSVKFIKK